MRVDILAKLKSFFVDPEDPRWSSQMIIDIFDALPGNEKSKQQAILPIVDEVLSSKGSALNDVQFELLKDITIRTRFTNSRVIFTRSDLDWLLQRFTQNPTQQRATLIVMLLESKKIPTPTLSEIKTLLANTRAVPYLDD